jgi:hypothetical protein
MTGISPAQLSRPELIAYVISQRKPLAVRIQQAIRRMETLRTALADLEKARDRIVAELYAAAGIEDAAGRVSRLALDRIRAEADEEIASLRRLMARLGRDTINVGIAGYAKQGKSLTLQRISGLDDTAIPTSDAGHCTGVKSLIVNHPDATTRGQVRFFSEHDFLRTVIWPYYDRLPLGQPPATLDEFGAADLRPLTEVTEATEKSYLAKLLDYQAELPQYRPLFDEPAPRAIEASEIREFVAYASKPLDGRPEKYYKHRAVRSVTIYCRFPHRDVGCVALVDLPGLGDHNINDSNLLQQTLADDADFLVFLKKPSAQGDYIGTSDTSIYDLARKSIPELPIAQWSMFVLNRVSGGADGSSNARQCAACAEQVSGKNIQVLRTATVDCSDRDEVGREIVDWILNYLAEHLAGLDRTYASGAQSRLKQRVAAWSEQLKQARAALGRPDETSEEGEVTPFNRLFDQLWRELADGLGRLLKSFAEAREEEDNPISAAVNSVLEKCETHNPLPSMDQIESDANVQGGYPNAFYGYMNALRAHLSEQFLNIDGQCQDFLEGVKSRVTDVLLGRGRLAELFAKQGSAMLNELGDALEMQENGAGGSLSRGVRALAQAQLSYRGFVQHRIRMSLDRLTPDTLHRYETLVPKTAKEVAFVLEKQYSLAIGDVYHAVASWTQEPNQVAFALIEEFMDRVLRAEGSREAWREFYAAERGRLWKGEFQALNRKSRLRGEWNRALSVVMESASSAELGFLE